MFAECTKRVNQPFLLVVHWVQAMG